MEQVLSKIDKMSPAALSELVCAALDDAGVRYARGKSDITFSGLSVDDNTYHFSLQFEVCSAAKVTMEKHYERPKARWKEYSYQTDMNNYSNPQAAIVA